MLKRTMMLLGLTITVGALLLVVGCGGHNAASTLNSDQQQSRWWGQNSPDASVSFSRQSAPTVQVNDPDGILLITVQYVNSGNPTDYQILRFNGQNEVKFTLRRDPATLLYVMLHITDASKPWGAYDSSWGITPDGQVKRIAP